MGPQPQGIPSWNVRRYREEDREEAFKLYDAVYGEDKGALCRRSWTWEYEENPCSPGRPPVWVAESGGRLVGLYATIAATARWGSEVRRICWSTDLMTRREFRGRGIFGELTDRAIEESVQDGISIFLVFPNENSGPIMKRRGWREVTVIPSMVKSLSVTAALRKVSFWNIPSVGTGALAYAGRSILRFLGPKPSPALSSLRITEVESFDSRMDAFFEKAGGDHDFMVVRDEEYLNWRYVRCPHRDYTILLAEEGDEVLGYAVLSRRRDGGERGYIVDFLTRSCPGQTGVIDSLLRRAVGHLREAGMSSIELCAMGDPYGKILEGHGFVPLPGRHFGGYNLVGRIEPGGSGSADFSDIGRWFITRGDADSDIAME